MAIDEPLYGRMLPGIRGIRLAVLQVDAKFKFDDHNPSNTANASSSTCRSAATDWMSELRPRQQRRLAAIGDWRTRRR